MFQAASTGVLTESDLNVLPKDQIGCAEFTSHQDCKEVKDAIPFQHSRHQKPGIHQSVQQELSREQEAQMIVAGY